MVYMWSGQLIESRATRREAVRRCTVMFTDDVFLVGANYILEDIRDIKVVEN